MGTLNATTVGNSPGWTGATYNCAASVARNRGKYATTLTVHLYINFQEHQNILDNTTNINYTLFGKKYSKVLFVHVSLSITPTLSIFAL